MLFKSRFTSNKSIKSQVIIFLITGVSLMVFIIGIITATAVNQQSRQLMLKNAFQITEGLAKQAVFPLLSGSSQNAQEAMNQVIGFQSVIAARLLAENGDEFLTIGKYPNKVKDTDKTSTTLTAIQAAMVVAETDDYWVIKSPINIESASDDSEASEFELDVNEVQAQLIGFSMLIYSKENLKRVQARVGIIITSVGIISVVLLSLLLHVGLQRVFTPLTQLAKTMQQAEESGEHLSAKIEGAKEIRRMAYAYNSMMAVLDQQDEKLKRHRNQLEKEVSIRTKELVQARDTAIIASKHKSEFMANMSHELRTPIQSIIGYGELVIEELELEGNFDLIDDMDKISKNSQRLLIMINSLLDLAKIEAGKTDLNESEILISDVEKNLLDTIQPIAQKNNNNFSVIQQSELTHITLDKEKLEQVLLNLLSNACKFTKDGEITLSIHNDKTYLYFDIKDTGIGLSEKQQKYIFEEFRQVDSSQQREFSGTGLGLAISKRFTELMKGRLSVVSKINHGAIFTVRLPLNLIRREARHSGSLLAEISE